jgi:Zn-dependent peptidase ImmA (M78 family)/transcriptional regulator with XRE-family HTH domain
MPSDLPLPNDPRLVALQFDREQLRRGREMRGLTKVELAERIRKSPAALTLLEQGGISPDPETVSRLCLALRLPAGYFARRSIGDMLSLESCHFRSLRSTGLASRKAARAFAEEFVFLARFLATEGVEFPKESISGLRSTADSDPEIEAVALKLRESAGLGLGPLPQLLALVESLGVLILPLPNVSEKLDGFSTWHLGRPLIFVSLNRPASRVHFDVAHELGHLLLHEDVSPGDSCAEDAANRFASALMLPRETYRPESPRRWNLHAFQALKSRWRASIQALVMRSFQIGSLTEASKKNAFRDIAAAGNKRAEPGEWKLEKPTVLTDALCLVFGKRGASYVEDRFGYSSEALSELLGPLSPQVPALGFFRQNQPFSDTEMSTLDLMISPDLDTNSLGGED